MLLETMTCFPIFCLKFLVWLWSDFEIGSSSLLLYKYMCDTYIGTFVCSCICMSVILSVFILGSVVDFIQAWNKLHNMLMTLPSFESPVWVLDVRLYATFNSSTISVSIVRTTTTYYQLGDLYGMWLMLEVYMLLYMCKFQYKLLIMFKL